jgi:hypothetical protein
MQGFGSVFIQYDPDLDCRKSSDSDSEAQIVAFQKFTKRKNRMLNKFFLFCF